MQAIESTFELVDTHHRPLGRVLVESRQDGVILGRFVPGPAFPAVQHLFRRFEQAVNAQALSVVDELDTQIAALGLRLRLPGEAREAEIQDVQIWSDGSISFRLPEHTSVYASSDRLMMARVPQS